MNIEKCSISFQYIVKLVNLFKLGKINYLKVPVDIDFSQNLVCNEKSTVFTSVSLLQTSCHSKTGMLITSKASSKIQRKAVAITRRSILQTSATGQAESTATLVSQAILVSRFGSNFGEARTFAHNPCLIQHRQQLKPENGGFPRRGFRFHYYDDHSIFRFQRLQPVELWWGTACKLYCLQCKKAFSIIPACATRLDPRGYQLSDFEILPFQFSYDLRDL